jgi:hypothetical protein
VLTAVNGAVLTAVNGAVLTAANGPVWSAGTGDGARATARRGTVPSPGAAVGEMAA